MGTTPAGLPYPEQTDSVDVVRDVKALADAIDLKIFRAWTVFVPTFQDFGLGNGTVSARYLKVGKTIHYQGAVGLGSTTALNANAVQISLPFNPAVGYPLGVGLASDASAALIFPLVAVGTAGLFFALRAPNGNPITVSQPFAWATPDAFGWNLTYETNAAA